MRALNFTLCGLILLLTGCATLSSEQCRSGNWRSIGRVDGLNGQPQERMDLHRDACADVSVEPNQDLYDKGRVEGLHYYCSVAGGLRAGRQGRSYAGVCSVEQEPDFLAAYDLGREINSLRNQVWNLQSHHHSRWNYSSYSRGGFNNYRHGGTRFNDPFYDRSFPSFSNANNVEYRLNQLEERAHALLYRHEQKYKK